MQNKLFAIMLTALLMLAFAGSAMCTTTNGNGNGCGDPCDYILTEIWTSNDTGVKTYKFTAGEMVVIWALVNNSTVVVDEVNANFTEHGEGIVPMVFNDTKDDYTWYRGEVVIEQATDDEYARVGIMVSFTENDNCYAERDIYVGPGPCDQLVIEGPDKALTRSYSCTDEDSWYDEFLEIVFDFLEYPFAADLYVTCVDEYGNPTEDCVCDMKFTRTGSASISKCYPCYYPDSHQIEDCAWCVKVTDWYTPETVTVTADCICSGTDVGSASHDVTFLNPIADLYVTSDPGFLYEIADPECGEDLDCTDVSARLIDSSGEPIPMPDVLVRFAVNGCWYGDDAYTDDNGTATTTIPLCMTEVYGDEISVSAYSVCNKGIMTIDVVEPELYRVEITGVPEVMACGGEPVDLDYTCWTDHDTQMCCPTCGACEPSNVAWNCINGLGSFDPIDERSTCFTALDSGTAVVEVNVSGVIETAEIVINCTLNCADIPDGCICSPYPFEVTSGSVTLSGNFTETGCEITGWACVEAIGDPISGWSNDTRGAIVNVSEDRTEDVMLNLSGKGDTWKYNGTTGNWSKYADGAVSAVSNGTYALVTPAVDPEPDTDPTPEPTPTATARKSGSGGSGSGTYPPGWGSSTSSNTTQPDNETSVPIPTSTMPPKSPTTPDDSGETNVTDKGKPKPTPTPDTPGFIAVFAIAGILGIAYLIGRRRE